jgi:dodecin
VSTPRVGGTTTEEAPVSNVYKKIELVGSSRDGVDDAIRRAIHKAGESMRNLDWFEVKEIRGWIQDGEPQHTQVTIQVGFRLEDD